MQFISDWATRAHVTRNIAVSGWTKAQPYGGGSLPPKKISKANQRLIMLWISGCASRAYLMRNIGGWRLE